MHQVGLVLFVHHIVFIIPMHPVVQYGRGSSRDDIHHVCYWSSVDGITHASNEEVSAHASICNDNSDASN